jgi:hypothetical protein
MSGADGPSVMPKCPLFTGNPHPQAQWAYSENHKSNGVYYRHKDVAKTFFRIDNFSIIMAPETQHADRTCVYEAMQLIMSLARPSQPALDAICQQAFGVQPHSAFFLDPATTEARVAAVLAQSTVPELRLGIAFGWLLALVALNTNHVNTIIEALTQ